MANRYWVGPDTSNILYWTDTSNWSETSGGTSGASYPYLSSDTAIFDANSNLTGTNIIKCTIHVTVACAISGYPANNKLLLGIGNGSLSLQHDISGIFGITVSGGGILTLNGYDISVTDVFTWAANTINIGSSTLEVGICSSSVVYTFFDMLSAYSGGIPEINSDGAIIKVKCSRDDADYDNHFGIGYGSLSNAQVYLYPNGHILKFGLGGTYNHLSITGNGSIKWVMGASYVPPSRSSDYLYSYITTESGLTLEGNSSSGLTITYYVLGSGYDTGVFSMSNGRCNAKNCNISYCTAIGGASFSATTSNGNTRGSYLTGWSTTATYGISASSGSVSSSGSDVNFHAKIPVSPGDFTLSGTVMTGQVAHKLSVNSGHITETGSTVSFPNTHYVVPSLATDSNIFNDFEFGDFVNLDTMMWGGGTGAGGYEIQADSGVFSEAGTSIDLKAARLLAAANGVLTETGTDVALQKNTPLEIAAGSFVSEGTAVEFKATRVLSASSGVIAETGQAVGLSATRVLAVESGEITEAGQDVQLSTIRKLAVENGTMALSGSEVELTPDYASPIMTADSGEFAVVGQSVDLLKSSKIQTLFGDVTASGSEVGLKRFAKLLTDSGVIEAAGQSVGLITNRTLTAEAGTVNLSGQGIDIKATRKISATPGDFSLTGTETGLLLSRTIQALFGVSEISGSDIGLKRFTKLLIESGVFTITGQEVDLSTLGINLDRGAIALSGKDISFARGRAFFVETVYSTPKVTSIVATEKINRVTAESRITRIS